MKEMKLMLLVLLVAVAGCKSSDNSLTLLRAKEWQLKSMTENGKEVKNPQQIPTLVFSDSSAVYGSAGCNRFFGTYEVGEKGKMTFKTGGATMMFCPDMPFEDAYLKALNKVEPVSYTHLDVYKRQVFVCPGNHHPVKFTDLQSSLTRNQNLGVYFRRIVFGTPDIILLFLPVDKYLRCV